MQSLFSSQQILGKINCSQRAQGVRERQSALQYFYMNPYPPLQLYYAVVTGIHGTQRH